MINCFVNCFDERQHFTKKNVIYLYHQFLTMSKITKIVLLTAVLNGIMFTSLADRGVGKAKKNNSNFKSTISLNLKTGLKYKGSLLTGVSSDKTSLTTNNLVTYQKGNTIYVVPYKQKIIISEVKQGYTGMKLIIKPKL